MSLREPPPGEDSIHPDSKGRGRVRDGRGE